mmetsp:Transcript_22249/g.72013  ORF Transcript_22249/g.72013 Transcript_22249/m.72013 type:complete len:840 (-) Transcript_22249:240-2759(-)
MKIQALRAPWNSEGSSRKSATSKGASALGGGVSDRFAEKWAEIRARRRSMGETEVVPSPGSEGSSAPHRRVPKRQFNSAPDFGPGVGEPLPTSSPRRTRFAGISLRELSLPVSTRSPLMPVGSDDKGEYQQVPLADVEIVDGTLDVSPLRRCRSKRTTMIVVDNTGWRRAANIVLESVFFQTFIAFSIFSNGLIIGCETDMPGLPLWDTVETFFLIVFTTELGLRLTVIGIAGYFDHLDQDFLWNMFDFAIVSLGILDAGFSAMGLETSGGGASLFRMFRLLRILRIFKIVRFLKKLYMLAYGFIEACKAVFWVTVLMIFVLYICSVVLVRTIGHHKFESPELQSLATNFSDITRTMLTLFEIMSQPELEQFQPLFNQFPLFGGFLIAFTIFGSFGMIALLTGVISESMFEKNQLRMEEERQQRDLMHRLLSERCFELFDDLEKSGALNENGEVSKDAVMALLPDVIELLEGHLVAFSQHDLVTILDLMDVSDSGFVKKDEFCKCILSVAEGVRPMSLMEVLYAVVKALEHIRLCQVSIDKLTQDVVHMQTQAFPLAARMLTSNEGGASNDVMDDGGESKPRLQQQGEGASLASIVDALDRIEALHLQQGQQQQQKQPAQNDEQLPTLSAGVLDRLDALQLSVDAVARVQDEVLVQGRSLASVGHDRLQQQQQQQQQQTLQERAAGPQLDAAGLLERLDMSAGTEAQIQGEFFAQHRSQAQAHDTLLQQQIQQQLIQTSSFFEALRGAVSERFDELQMSVGTLGRTQDELLAQNHSLAKLNDTIAQSVAALSCGTRPDPTPERTLSWQMPVLTVAPKSVESRVQSPRSIGLQNGATNPT